MAFMGRHEKCRITPSGRRCQRDQGQWAESGLGRNGLPLSPMAMLRLQVSLSLLAMLRAVNRSVDDAALVPGSDLRIRRGPTRRQLGEAGIN